MSLLTNGPGEGDPPVPSLLHVQQPQLGLLLSRGLPGPDSSCHPVSGELYDSITCRSRQPSLLLTPQLLGHERKCRKLQSLNRGLFRTDSMWLSDRCSCRVSYLGVLVEAFLEIGDINHSDKTRNNSII